MSTYDRIVRTIEQNKENRENGNFNCISFPFKRYSEYLEGFSKGDYIGLMGYTGSGKSRLVRYWMYHMIDFAMNNKYKLKVLYFSLEDPEVPVGLKVMSHYLYTRHGISISAKSLMSREVALSEQILKLIKADELFWRLFYTYVEIINNITTPNQIRQKVRDVYEKNKDSHIVVIIDNQSNIGADPEDENDWAAIKRLSRDIVRLGFCAAGITTIQVLQIDADTERNTFRNAGKSGLINIEPNLSSIADAKIVSRSMHYIFGLFSPWRFEIEKYPSVNSGYDISILRNTFVSLLQLKSNEGEMAPRFGLRFNGLHEIFSEMPMLDNKPALDELYKEVLLQQRERVERLALFPK